MCGIAGIINLGKEKINQNDIVNMSKVIGHRGPDDEGFVFINTITNKYQAYSSKSSCKKTQQTCPTLNGKSVTSSFDIGMAHRRFSIIDLSSKGHQPFFSYDKSVCVIFNGEIYNYIELRQELENKGVVFHTRSDTEVLVESYICWGTGCFNKFNGFWALAIYDFNEKKLILSRDRIGKKPLFYTRYGDTIAFASEIKSLLQINHVNKHKQVNSRAVFNWLIYGKKNLYNDSFYDGIMMLPAGTWAVINTNFPNNINKFWQLPTQRLQERDISISEASIRVQQLLENAVKIRLRADVPVSVELSGGMDSSTLVALAAKYNSEQITTFTVKFPEKKWNEEPYARLVAERFNTDYHVLEKPTNHFWQHILSFTYLEEEPYHAPNLQTNQEIWQQMRSLGMKVSLNGAAGDEVFAGYPTYFNSALLENIQQGQFLDLLNNLFKYSETDSVIKNIYRLARFTIGLSLDSMMPHWRKILNKNNAYIFNEQYGFIPKGNLLSSMLHSSMIHTPMPYWLCSGDRGYMGIPIEVRAPFLDYKLVEYVFQLPTSYLIRNGWHKWILRKAMDNILPHEVNWRKTKLGFPFPLEQFLAENKNIVEYIFAHSSNPYIDFNKKEMLYSNWRTISFVLWYELFFNENISLFNTIESMASKQIFDKKTKFVPSYYDTCNQKFG